MPLMNVLTNFSEDYYCHLLKSLCVFAIVVPCLASGFAHFVWEMRKYQSESSASKSSLLLSSWLLNTQGYLGIACALFFVLITDCKNVHRFQIPGIVINCWTYLYCLFLEIDLYLSRDTES